MPRNYDLISKAVEDNNPWSEYRRLILQGLEENSKDTDKVEAMVMANDKELWNEITKFKLKCTEDLTALKVKAGLIAFISSALVSAIIVILFKLVFKI